MRYAMAFKDPEVIGPLQLPSPSSQSVRNGEEEIVSCIAVWGGGLFGADKLETDFGFVGPIHLPPPPGHRQANTVEPPDADGGSRGAVSGQSEDTDASSSDGSDSSSTSSSGMEIIEPLAGRLQSATQPAFRVGKAGGGGVRPRKRRRPGAQGNGGQGQTVRTTKRVVPVGVPGPEQRKRAPGAPVGVASQPARQPATPQRCFVRPCPEQAEAGEGPPSKRRCLAASATAVNEAATEAPRGRFEGRQRRCH